MQAAGEAVGYHPRCRFKIKLGWVGPQKNHLFYFGPTIFSLKLVFASVKNTSRLD